MPLKDLSDSQILEKEKNLKDLDFEYSKILNWITELVKAGPADYEKTNEILYKARQGKANLRKLKDEYQENSELQIVEGDLSVEKMKNTSFLKLDVPKYHGYGSSLHFYTFKSEFEKLISGRIQAKLLPDYLKCNFLKGQALDIVKEIHQMDEIWERLKNAFGNVNILLNNKLIEVVKYGPLWKIKNDEKIIQVMIKLVNGTQLGTLAKNHKIDDILYHPSDLVKIYELIGRKRQFKCMEQCLGKEMSIKDEWIKIIGVLSFELKLKEKALLLDKTKPGGGG